ncbi:MAG: hypothetical protein FWD17_17325 [Polyangiaceae bacterium]|nr:hypothetical protein [Polyangiaceae bacterium]
MFGLSFGELLMVLLVAMVVLGPKELPKYLRKAGQFAGRIQRLALEMRAKSGIDEVLRSEGIDRDIAEIRRLTRGEITGLAAAIRATRDGISVSGANNGASNGSPLPPAPPGAPAATTAPAAPAPSIPYAPPEPLPAPATTVQINRAREFPNEGADSYDALPESAPVYGGELAPSALAEDPLYARGEAAPQQPAALEASS